MTTENGNVFNLDAIPFSILNAGTYTLTRFSRVEVGNVTLIVGVPDGGVLLGDVNLDGVVNLLDVDPFIALLSTGTFQAEADVNQDRVVNLLDVDPFILILSGG